MTLDFSRKNKKSQAEKQKETPKNREGKDKINHLNASKFLTKNFSGKTAYYSENLNTKWQKKKIKPGKMKRLK